jgi:CHAD domain-containing protein
LDVQIELLNKVITDVTDKKILPGLRRVGLRLKQRRADKQSKTIDLTRAVIKSPTLSEMQDWCEKNTIQETGKSTALFKLGFLNIQSHLDEFLFFEIFIFDPGRERELHQMRIAAKKLRYSLEVFSDLYDHKTDFSLDIARQSQEILGQIHDADVWISYLPGFIEREQKIISQFYGYSRPYSRLHPGIEYLMNDRIQERTKMYKKFIDQWRKWKLKESWLNLRKVIFLTNNESIKNQDAPPAQTDGVNHENDTGNSLNQDSSINEIQQD